jgi:mono/diheme cytochrome c family protein
MKKLLCVGAIVTAGWPSIAGAAAARSTADTPVTFARDIAPILFRQCAPCHRPDGAAPFSLMTYDEARRRAGQIVEVTKSRYMPPWKPDAGVEFVGERRLTDTDIAIIQRWVSGGLLDGNASDLPSPPRFTAGWQLGEPDLVLPFPEYILRADGADVFRNFVIPVPDTGARYVRAVEFRPGSRAVHHANIRVDPTSASRDLDASDPMPGYEGEILHSADYPDGYFLGWTPGQTAPLASHDIAWRLEAGSDLVVQLHLKPTGKPERIQPSTEPRHPPGPFRLHRLGRIRAAGRRRSPRHSAARPLSCASRLRLGDPSGRRATAADRDHPVGFQLAGSVPLCGAVLAARGHDDRDGVRVRQLRRQPAES